MVRRSVKFAGILATLFLFIGANIQNISFVWLGLTNRYAALIQVQNPQMNAEGNAENTHLQNDTKYILLWTSWAGEAWDWGMGEGPKAFHKCQFNNCYFTANETLKPVEDFDAVLFHSWQMFANLFSIPLDRSAKQRYMLFSTEPELGCGYLNDWEYSVLGEFFNATATFRSDSDVHVPYGKSQKMDKDHSTAKQSSAAVEQTSTSYQQSSIRNKSSEILFVTSHCVTSSQREDYARELNRSIPVTFKGFCAKYWDPSDVSPRVHGRSSSKFEPGKYYFYLAFENTICKDYVTEKFFDGLSEDVVPIVLGGADHARLAPPHSFIDTRDFHGPHQLAQYLRFLMENPEKYSEYFAWKKDYIVENLSHSDKEFDDRIPSGFACNLCEYLNTQTDQKVYSDLRDWWKVRASCSGWDRVWTQQSCGRENEAEFGSSRQNFKKLLKSKKQQKVVHLQNFV